MSNCKIVVRNSRDWIHFFIDGKTFAKVYFLHTGPVILSDIQVDTGTPFHLSYQFKDIEFYKNLLIQTFPEILDALVEKIGLSLEQCNVIIEAYPLLLKDVKEYCDQEGSYCKIVPEIRKNVYFFVNGKRFADWSAYSPSVCVGYMTYKYSTIEAYRNLFIESPPETVSFIMKQTGLSLEKCNIILDEWFNATVLQKSIKDSEK